MTKTERTYFAIRMCIYAFIILYSLFGIIDDENSICMFHNLTSLECYTCGMTRAFMCFFRFDFIRGIQYNPLVIFFIPIFIFILVEDVTVFIYNVITKQARPSFIKHYMF